MLPRRIRKYRREELVLFQLILSGERQTNPRRLRNSIFIAWRKSRGAFPVDRRFPEVYVPNLYGVFSPICRLVSKPFPSSRVTAHLSETRQARKTYRETGWVAAIIREADVDSAPERLKGREGGLLLFLRGRRNVVSKPKPSSTIPLLRTLSD